jgi:hypothetical protein
MRTGIALTLIALALLAAPAEARKLHDKQSHHNKRAEFQRVLQMRTLSILTANAAAEAASSVGTSQRSVDGIINASLGGAGVPVATAENTK